MLTAQIFSNITYFCITIFCLSVFYLSSRYITKEGYVNKTVKNCFRGYFACFLAGAIISQAEHFSSFVSFAVFFEIAFLLISLCFFIAFSSKILLRTTKPTIFLSILCIGLASDVFFSFISPDGAMIDKLRFLFPLAGFGLLFFAFWSKATKKTMSYTIAAIISFILSMQYFLHLIGVTVFAPWWLPAVSYIMMTVFVFMHSSEELSSKLTETNIKLKQDGTKLKEIINSSPFPILISRLSDDGIIIANKDAMSLFGIYKEDTAKYKLKDFFADIKVRKKLGEELEKFSGVQDFEFLADTPSSIYPFWLSSSASVIEYDSTPVLYMAFQDITTRKDREALLKDQATKDPLTGIFNRRHFEDCVAKKISKASKNKENFAILMIDADHFKKVNDTYGHKSGDNVLIALANTCEKSLRGEDVVARFGGEEFVMYLATVDESQALKVANRLRENISNIVVKSDNDKDIKFTVSVGVCSSQYSKDLETLTKHADLALYKAKENGRNRAEAYTKEFDKDAHKLEGKKDSRHPIYDLETLEKDISLVEERIDNDLHI